jgi:hypothetical protein
MYLRLWVAALRARAQLPRPTSAAASSGDVLRGVHGVLHGRRMHRRRRRVVELLHLIVAEHVECEAAEFEKPRRKYYCIGSRVEETGHLFKLWMVVIRCWI